MELVGGKKVPKLRWYSLSTLGWGVEIDLIFILRTADSQTQADFKSLFPCKFHSGLKNMRLREKKNILC